jgi:hypothetical protein
MVGTDSRRRLLHAAGGFALVPPTEPELKLLQQWLDCWRGVGDVGAGMNRQGYWAAPLECRRRHMAGDVLA